MKWLNEAIRDSKDGLVSSSRVISMMAGSTLSLSTLLLTVGAFWKPELVAPLTAFGPVLATLAGANYVTNRIQEGKAP